MSSYKTNLTRENCQPIFEEFLKALYERTATLQGVADSKRYTGDFFSESPKQIVSRYLNENKNLQKQNPLHFAPDDEDLASAYLICRFISSATNQRYGNTFKSHFNASWTPLKKHFRGEPLSNIETEKLNKHIYYVLGNLNYDNILDKYQRTTSASSKKNKKESVKMLLNELKENYLKKDPSRKEIKNFEFGKRKLLTKLCETILDACAFIKAKGGALAYLEQIQQKIKDPTLSDLQKTIQLSQEIKHSVTGYGDALAMDFFKDMGIEIFSKPDVHVTKTLIELFPYLIKPKAEAVAQILLEIAEKASTPTRKVSAFQVDKTIWLLRSGRYYLHYASTKPKAYPLNEDDFKLICGKISKAIPLPNKVRLIEFG